MTKNQPANCIIVSKTFAAILVVFAIGFGYHEFFLKSRILAAAKNDMSQLAVSTALQIESVLRDVESTPHQMIHTFQKNYPTSEKEVYQAVVSMVDNNPAIFGAAIAFEPYDFLPDTLYFSPYALRKDEKISSFNIGCDDYNYFSWDWYQTPKEINSPVWSEPYFDEGGGNIMMATYSVPFSKMIDNTYKFSGIITSDISLSWLEDKLKSIKIYDTGYVFLISHHGRIVAHPDHNLVMRESIFSLAEINNDQILRETGRKMVNGQKVTTMVHDFFTQKPAWLFAVPLSANNWSLAILVPEEEILKPAASTAPKIIITCAIISLLIVVTIAMHHRKKSCV